MLSRPLRRLTATWFLMFATVASFGIVVSQTVRPIVFVVPIEGRLTWASRRPWRG